MVACQARLRLPPLEFVEFLYRAAICADPARLETFFVIIAPTTCGIIELTRSRRTPDADLAGFSGAHKKVPSAFFPISTQRKECHALQIVRVGRPACGPFMLFGASANAEEFTAKMVGFHEAPTSIFSANGQGTLHLDLDKKARTITFKETFSGLSSPVTQSHIHLGEIHTAGGVTVFFLHQLEQRPGPALPGGRRNHNRDDHGRKCDRAPRAGLASR